MIRFRTATGTASERLDSSACINHAKAAWKRISYMYTSSIDCWSFTFLRIRSRLCLKSNSTCSYSASSATSCAAAADRLPQRLERSQVSDRRHEPDRRLVASVLESLENQIESRCRAPFFAASLFDRSDRPCAPDLQSAPRRRHAIAPNRCGQIKHPDDCPKRR